MLDNLRKKLTLLCVLSTTAILIFITLIAFNFSVKELNKRSHLTLTNEVTSIVKQIQGTSYISDSWLAEQELSGHFIISLCSQNHSLLFSGAYTTSIDRNTLLQTAREIGKSKYDFDAFSYYLLSDTDASIYFPVQIASEHFLASITVISHGDQSYELIVMKDMAQDNSEIFYLKLIFISLILWGILLLGLFSWWFAGNAIKPIKSSHQEQIDFVAAASHELRSPVAVIQAVTEEMLQAQSEPSKQGLHTIHNECTHLSRLINDLLFLARADSGRWSINMQPVEVDTLLLDIYGRFLPLVEAHEQLLDIHLPDVSLKPIMLDKQRIEQVLSILIDNAMSYTPPHSQITLTLDVSEKNTQIGVVDNGPGIPHEESANIFKRFYRLDTSRKSDAHYGLGLNIAHEILKLHGGELILDPTYNDGCAFKLILPTKKFPTSN